MKRSKICGAGFQFARRGFTLIEILVVVTILAILASAVMLSFSGTDEEAKVTLAKSNIRTYETALEKFKLEMGRYPEEEEGLMALLRRPETDDAEKWRGPYVKRIEKDPWGNPFVYIYPGYYNTEGYDLLSYGKDGQEGGEGKFDKDIGNWPEDEDMMPAGGGPMGAPGGGGME